MPTGACSGRRELWTRHRYDDEQALAITHSEVEIALASRPALLASEQQFNATDERAQELTGELAALAERSLQVPADQRWERLCAELALAPGERELLALALAAELQPALRGVYGYLQNGTAARGPQPRAGRRSVGPFRAPTAARGWRADGVGARPPRRCRSRSRLELHRLGGGPARARLPPGRRSRRPRSAVGTRGCARSCRRRTDRAATSSRQTRSCASSRRSQRRTARRRCSRSSSSPRPGRAARRSPRRWPPASAACCTPWSVASSPSLTDAAIACRVRGARPQLAGALAVWRDAEPCPPQRSRRRAAARRPCS